MLKLLIGLVGLVEALYPDRFLSILTDLSYDYQGERPTAKPWVVTAARIEGVILLGVAIRAAIKVDRAIKTDAESTDVDGSETGSEPSGTVDRI
jgi:hypothetical protein